MKGTTSERNVCEVWLRDVNKQFIIREVVKELRRNFSVVGNGYPPNKSQVCLILFTIAFLITDFFGFLSFFLSLFSKRSYFIVLRSQVQWKFIYTLMIIMLPCHVMSCYVTLPTLLFRS